MRDTNVAIFVTVAGSMLHIRVGGQSLASERGLTEAKHDVVFARLEANTALHMLSRSSFMAGASPSGALVNVRSCRGSVAHGKQATSLWRRLGGHNNVTSAGAKQ